MSAIQVIKIIENYPEAPYGEDYPETFERLTTVDILIDGKYVRMGYRASEIRNATDIKTLLIRDAEIIKSAYKQEESAFIMPAGKTERPTLIPADFNI